MKHVLLKVKNKSPKQFTTDELIAHSKNINAACKAFELACISLQELGMLTEYRKYELELFLKRNKWYAESTENTAYLSKMREDERNRKLQEEVKSE